jgi:hypothetical protein
MQVTCSLLLRIPTFDPDLIHGISVDMPEIYLCKIHVSIVLCVVACFPLSFFFSSFVLTALKVAIEEGKT